MQARIEPGIAAIPPRIPKATPTQAPALRLPPCGFVAVAGVGLGEEVAVVDVVSVVEVGIAEAIERGVGDAAYHVHGVVQHSTKDQLVDDLCMSS